MFGFLKQREGAIGIDLGSAALKMVQLSAGDDGVRLLAAARAEIPSAIQGDLRAVHEWRVKAVREMLAKKPFKGKRAVTCLPGTDLSAQHVRLPKLSDEQLNVAVTQAAAEKLPFDTESALLRHIVAGEVYDDETARLEVILLAAGNDAVERHLDLIERTRINIAAINVELSALLSGFAPVLQADNDGNEATMFVDLGHAATKVVVAHGGHVVFNRRLPVGGQHLRSGHLRKDDGKTNGPKPMLAALCHDLKSCRRYHDMTFPATPVARAILLGGLAKDTALCRLLGQALQVRTMLGDPMARISEDTRIGPHSDLAPGEPHPDWAISFGLGLAGLWTIKAARPGRRAANARVEAAVGV